MFDRYRRRSRLISHPLGYLWTDPPAATDPPTPPVTPPAATDPPTPPVTTPAQSFSYPEDRSAWVKPDIHKKAETAVNRTASELTRLQNELAIRDKKIAALAGVNPPDPKTAEADQIAEAFFALPQFAHLKNVTPELLDQVRALVADGASITAARDHVWNQHTDKFLADLDNEFAAEIGVDTLTPGQQRKLHAAFDAMVPNERTDAEAFGTFKRRFEQADPKLISEFVKEYVSDMLEPARRLATLPVTQRRAVPRSGSGSPVVTQVPKPDYSKMSIAEMLDSAEKSAGEAGR